MSNYWCGGVAHDDGINVSLLHAGDTAQIMTVWRLAWLFLHMGAWMLVAATTEQLQHAQALEEHDGTYAETGSPNREMQGLPNIAAKMEDDIRLDGVYTVSATRRHLLVSDVDNTSIPLNASECTDINNPPAGYNDSCDYVLKHCQDKHELIPYLNIVMCNLKDVKVST